MFQLSITDEAFGASVQRSGEPLKQRETLKLSRRKLTLRDVIRLRVEDAMMNCHDADTHARFSASASQTSQAKARQRSHWLLPEQRKTELAVQKAIAAFEDHAYFVLADYLPVATLDHELDLSAVETLTFVRVTPI
ncbi:MAG: hypothetical protein AAFR60_04950 [Pseudomonadota bacterium]